MMQLFHNISQQCSRNITEEYSTSFASAITLLHRDLRTPIYNIYGFVRLADEIVDTFHDHDKHRLLEQFRRDTFDAIDMGISLNPVLHSFQLTVNKYSIDHELIHAFFRSMEMDLSKDVYDKQGYSEYIYGSAEVVGLMCLYIFCEGNKQQFNHLKPFAQALGAAFQKVNFLRDVQADFHQLNRTYFPGIDFYRFNNEDKKRIEAEIAADFHKAFEGIKQLPIKARFGVYVAYKYYLSLFRKIRRIQPSRIMQERIRIPNYGKMLILVRAQINNHLLGI